MSWTMEVMSVPVPIMPDPSPSNVVAPGGLPSPVNAFVQRHQKDILGVLSCFDRILFQGTLPKLRFAGGMEALLRNKGIQLKDYTQ
jgi:hypothetical protein